MNKELKCSKLDTWLSEEALQRAVKRREAKSKGEKERYLFECRVPKNSKEALIAISVTSGKSPV